MSLEKYRKLSNKEGLCRDCGANTSSPLGGTCESCGSRRLIHHSELLDLSIAHIDCDAFYAAVEKRDNPDLADRPVIIGGGRRGVVSTACYVARLHGVHSAMPMFKALRACPDAVVIKPNMSKYVAVGRQVRERLNALSPLVEPISIDEAFIDLTGTVALRGQSPAEQLVQISIEIERDLGISVSIGLSFNKFLAKVASDLNKPRGFVVVGKTDAEDFLADKPATVIWGVGKALAKKLHGDNVRTILDLRALDERTLMERYGSMGTRLYRLSRGQDTRRVRPNRGAKSISNETTFNEDLHREEDLRRTLWRLSERVSARLKEKDLAAAGVVLKLKTTNFRILTRSQSLDQPTQLAKRLFDATTPLLAEALNHGPFRLLGIGAQPLTGAEEADQPDLLNPEAEQSKAVEHVMDEIRGKLGTDAIVKGRGFRPQNGGKPGSKENNRHR